jgi:hypothetical protein
MGLSKTNHKIKIFSKWMTTFNILANGRLPQFLWNMKTILNFWKMEDDLNMLATGKKLNISTNGRQINCIPTLLETFLGLAQLASSNPHILGIGTAQALGCRRYFSLFFSEALTFLPDRKAGMCSKQNKTTRIPTKQKNSGLLFTPHYAILRGK